MKLKIIISCFLVGILYSCGSHKKSLKTKKTATTIAEPIPEKIPSIIEKEITKKIAKSNPGLNKETLAYIKKYAPIAVQEMHEYKIPASITLAQGILESGKGKSELALKSNNHFGIKCHVGWQGERVYHDDDEKGECFRKYIYPETSYKDHSLFLTQRKRYAFLFDYNIKNYKKWAYGLRKAGYATDRKYPEKLLKIIKEYKLYEFDELKENRKLNISKRDTAITAKELVYMVKKGDTLYSISKKFNISIDELQEVNNLSDSTISIGQELVIIKK